MKKLAEKYPDIEFCMATCSNANEEPRLENYHTFMGATYQADIPQVLRLGMKLQELIDNGTITKEQAKIGYVAAYPYAGSYFRLYGIFVSALDCTGCGNVRTLYEQLE